MGLPHKGRRTCKACGAPLLFARTPAGKAIPVDLRPPVYQVTEDLDGNAIAIRAEHSLVTHFATCPHAGEFSQRGRRRTAAPAEKAAEVGR